MKKLPLVFFLLILLFYKADAQNYFQQEVNYTISVTLDDKKHELSAEETIEYINNSPDELSFIYMHLWPNAYKNNSTALAKQLLENGKTVFYFSDEKDRGYIDSLDFKVNNRIVKWEYDAEHIDICKLILNESLKSGEKIVITTPFHVKIPKGTFSRLGHIGQSYQITQWYPKPAVYDLNGWNQMPYLDQGEFYSEFGSFDVFITLPKNYVLGATGDLVDGEEELDWLSRKAAETEAIKEFDKNDLSFPASSAETKTLHYKQSNVHDFAWFADKRYHVLKGEVITPHNKNKVTTWAIFTNTEANLWKKSITYINDAVYYYSLWNGDYPYNQVTAVEGALNAGAGMEYPNVTIIGLSGSAFSLETVIMHEVGHNWFYGILGSDERKHPWLDEGINSFYENRYIRTKYPTRKLVGEFGNNTLSKKMDMAQYTHKAEYELMYLTSAKKNEDQPIELPACNYTDFNYGAIVYSKTAIVFDYLMAYLGEEKMDKAMQLYFESWKFKHPQPDDLRKILEEVSGENLDWFFDDLIKSAKKSDYQIISSKKEDEGYVVKVKNTGDIKAPFALCGIKNKQSFGVVWNKGFEGEQVFHYPVADIDYFKIDCMQDMPEINRGNNILKIKGAFKRTEPFRFQFLGSLDNPNKTQLFFTPVYGWNYYNRSMLGMAFYNSLILQKKFECVLMPVYSFGTKDYSGSANLAYNWFPNAVFQQIRLGISAKRYAYSNEFFDRNYLKYAPEISFRLKKKTARSPIEQSFLLRSVNIMEDVASYVSGDPLLARNFLRKKYNNRYKVNEISYNLRNSRIINPFQMDVNLQQGFDFLKTSLTLNYEITLKKGKSIDLRLFAGAFLNKTNFSPYAFRMSGQTGYQDYLYDQIFLGRSENQGLLSQQFAETDGAFKIHTPLGQTTKWLTALNIKSSLPGGLPLRLYADIGITSSKNLFHQKILFDMGLDLSIVKNIVEVYFPLIMSKDISDNIKFRELKYFETVRFTLNLNLLNPFDFLRSIIG